MSRSRSDITLIIAHIEAELAKQIPARMLNSIPFPSASISGFPIIVPIHATIFRIKLCMATADELLPGTASVRYVVTVANTINVPKPKRKVPTSGTMTNSPLSTAHPYMRMPRGYMIAPTHVFSPNRPSASSSPPCLAAD